MTASFDPLRRLCADAVDAGVVPGVVALVSAGGQTLFHQAFGHRQLVPHALPATIDTVFDVASLTKAVAT